MINWLKNLRTSTAQNAPVPAFEFGLAAIDKVWTRNRGVVKDFSDKFVHDQAKNMAADLLRVATAENPRLANRHVLANCVDEYARFQVLTIDQQPMPDPTGLRGKPGISGELKGKLVELADADSWFKEFIHDSVANKTRNEIWDAVLLRYRIAWAWSTVFHQLRLAFDDINRLEGRDWYMPFVAAICAWHEHNFRKAIGLGPSLIATDTDWEALRLATYRDCVLSDDKYPDLRFNQPNY